jgi:hypothetical protein
VSLLNCTPKEVQEIVASHNVGSQSAHLVERRGR